MNFFSSKNDLQLGFSVIELLVALGIFTVMATSIVMLSSLALGDAGEALRKLRAQNYAREGIEAARSIRNEDWSNLAVGEHGLAIENDKWTFTGSSDNPEDNFERVLKVEDITEDKRRIISRVTYRTDTKERSVEFQTRLTNWEKETSHGGGIVGLGEEARDVYVDGDYAYLAVWGEGEGKEGSLAVVDVSNPDSPSLVGTFYPKNRGKALFVEGNYLYLVLDTNEIKVVDVSDPEDPEETSVIGGVSQASSIWVEDGYAYIGRTKKKKSVMVYNVEDPTSPQYVEYYSVGEYKVYGLELQDSLLLTTVGFGRGLDVTTGDYAYVAVDLPDEGFWGAYEIDQDEGETVALSPTEGLDVNAEGRDVDTWGDWGYVAVNNPAQGLARVDISDPSNPQFIEGVDIGAAGNGIFVRENYIYLATQNKDQGLTIVPR